jgi:DNA-binding MarR family transcriptional regulator
MEDQLLAHPVGDLVAALYEAAGALRRQGNDVASRVGQSVARWEVLYIVGETPASAAHVARRLGRTRQSVQRIVDLLKSEGLIAAQPNPFNRRSPLFAITSTGREVLHSMNMAGIEFYGLVFRHIDKSNLEELASRLRLLASLAGQTATGNTTDQQ